jgi:stalled ribosome rescue protein Dom34
MKKDVGLWIDHRKTVMVTVSGEKEEITEIASNMEKHVRYSGAADQVKGEDQVDRRFSDHLTKYYDDVISHIPDAASILILGPGEAKGEFAKRLQSEGLGASIVGVETVDKMTDRQIAAIVREHFAGYVA